MRIRSIKPEFWTNEKLSALPAETHMLAAALLNWADDEGYFNANPKLIQGALFPVRDLSGSLPVMLESLSTKGGIGYLEIRFSSDNRAYGLILNFKLHQVVNKPRDSAIRPLFEACSNGEQPVPVALPEQSDTPTGGNGREQGREEEQGTGKARLGRGRDEAKTNEVLIRQRMLQIYALTNRRSSTKWNAKELEAFKAAGLDKCADADFAEQIQPLLAYYGAELGELRPFWGTADSKDFRRRDLVTILSNWGGEVDRAVKFCEFVQKKADEAKAGRL